MKTIELTILVLPDGSIQILPQPALRSGEYRAVLVVEEPLAIAAPIHTPQPALKVKMLDWSAWPTDSTFRREEIYGDDGR